MTATEVLSFRVTMRYQSGGSIVSRQHLQLLSKDELLVQYKPLIQLCNLNASNYSFLVYEGEISTSEAQVLALSAEAISRSENVQYVESDLNLEEEPASCGTQPCEPVIFQRYYVIKI